jgi:hypothetical protein
MRFNTPKPPPLAFYGSGYKAFNHVFLEEKEQYDDG